MFKKIIVISGCAFSLLVSQKEDTSLVHIGEAQKSKPVMPDYLDAVSDIQPIQDIIRGYLNSFEPFYEIPVASNEPKYSSDNRYLSLVGRCELYIYDMIALVKKNLLIEKYSKSGIIGREISLLGQFAYFVHNQRRGIYELSVIDLDSGVKLFSSEALMISFNKLLFSQDGAYVAAYGWDRLSRRDFISLIATNNYKNEQKLDVLNYGCEAMQFSPDNKYLVWAGKRSIRVWDISSPPFVYADFGYLKQEECSNEDILNLAFISNTEFVSIDGDGLLVTWDLTKKTRKSSVNILKKNTALAVPIFSADKQFLAARIAGKLDQVIIWNLLQSKAINIKTGEEIWHIEFLRNSNLLAISYKSFLQIYDISSKKVIQEIPLKGQIAAAYKTTAFSPDGNYLAIGTPTNTQILVNQCMQLTNFKKQETACSKK